MTVSIDDFMTNTIEDLPEGLNFGNEVTNDDDAPDETPSPVGPGDDAPDAGDGDGSDDAPADADGADDLGDDADGGDGEPTDEEADDEPEPKAPVKKAKEPVIPKSRLDQALRKQRAAEQRAQEVSDELAEFRRQQAEANAPKPVSGEEIRAKMAAANEALIAGDTAKAAELQAELLEAIAAKPQAPVSEPEARDPIELIEQRLEFKQILRETYERFPELDENGGDFNEELSQEAVDLQRVYMERGYTMGEATRKAALAVAKLHDLEDRGAPTVAPRAEAVRKEQAAKTRQKVEKATRAAPPLGGRSDRSEEVTFDIHNASPDEFMALPESVRDRLLGNTI